MISELSEYKRKKNKTLNQKKRASNFSMTKDVLSSINETDGSSQEESFEYLHLLKKMTNSSLSSNDKTLGETDKGETNISESKEGSINFYLNYDNKRMRFSKNIVDFNTLK